MLPNIRAVIAAVAAALGLLTISFGMAAAFRVAQDDRAGFLHAELAQRGRQLPQQVAAPGVILIVDTPASAVLVVKRGPMGCAVIAGDVPSSLDAAFNSTGVAVEVLNVLGAGDAFSAGFLSEWVRGADYPHCTRVANACGALVVSRHGCALTRIRPVAPRPT